jgi:hypothetical protein
MFHFKKFGCTHEAPAVTEPALRQVVPAPTVTPLQGAPSPHSPERPSEFSETLLVARRHHLIDVLSEFAARSEF